MRAHLLRRRSFTQGFSCHTHFFAPHGSSICVALWSSRALAARVTKTLILRLAEAILSVATASSKTVKHATTETRPAETDVQAAVNSKMAGIARSKGSPASKSFAEMAF